MQVLQLKAGLPYTIKKNGSTSTLKNVNVFIDVVEEIIEDSNSIWVEEGTYQGPTPRQVESINIYNEKHNRIAVFLRSTDITLIAYVINLVKNPVV